MVKSRLGNGMILGALLLASLSEDRANFLSRLFVLRRTLSFRHGLPQHKFDLRIHTAQIIRRPLLDFFPQIRRNPQQKGFALFRRHVRCRACRY
jgi:hypothetical protein